MRVGISEHPREHSPFTFCTHLCLRASTGPTTPRDRTPLVGCNSRHMATTAELQKQLAQRRTPSGQRSDHQHGLYPENLPRPATWEYRCMAATSRGNPLRVSTLHTRRQHGPRDRYSARPRRRSASQ
ncbi:hypothetical protein SBRY_50490 [Actinacidiphila bryophytorum]|uniref:Uncharacterized protein n=1 Tax=Actinacidiphila bryophytorum TaxID=1436133 RepID=A0A9W4H4W7_9ACTN|nr:hypothetical protein SBRY_50490 [Actinacidiphila bryophytorum]